MKTTERNIPHDLFSSKSVATEIRKKLDNAKSLKQQVYYLLEFLTYTKVEIKDIFKNNTTEEILHWMLKALNEFEVMTTLEKATTLNMTEEEFLNEEVA